ncbi:uncharacterized protein LOC130298397 [Hyla sarda]|uniref:uncharacterized protein LOC130298397 n=1 Tax=Hyla sarda TaxID=327740 RepID=UPI0024C3B73D|nr:uncharacterized protein LOC130298397 [Hyla sarda]
MEKNRAGGSQRSLSQTIPEIFRSGQKSNMAPTPSRASSPVVPEEEDRTDESPAPILPADPMNPAELYRSIQLMFKAELSKAVADLSKQVGELGNRVSDMELRADDLAVAIEADRSLLSDHIDKLDLLELKIEDLENRSRRANVRIRGLPETVTDLNTTILNLFAALLPQTDRSYLLMDRVHRALGCPKNPDVPRDVVLRMHYPEMRDKVLQAARNVSPLPDMPPSVHLYAAPSTS